MLTMYCNVFYATPAPSTVSHNKHMFLLLARETPMWSYACEQTPCLHSSFSFVVLHDCSCGADRHNTSACLWYTRTFGHLGFQKLASKLCLAVVKKECYDSDLVITQRVRAKIPATKETMNCYIVRLGHHCLGSVRVANHSNANILYIHIFALSHIC